MWTRTLLHLIEIEALAATGAEDEARSLARGAAERIRAIASSLPAELGARFLAVHECARTLALASRLEGRAPPASSAARRG